MRDGIISRMAVMIALTKEYNYRRQQDDWKGGLRMTQIEKAVNSVPETLNRKKATNISEDGFLCSNCRFGDFGGFHGYEPNYCPNCGSDMQGT